MIYGMLEIEIMNAIWSLQDKDEDANISVGDIVDVLNKNNLERAYTTIKTVMDRLVSKDVLVRYRNGKKFYYRSAVEKNEAAKGTLSEIAGQFFNGNYAQMIRFIEKEFETILV